MTVKPRGHRECRSSFDMPREAAEHFSLKQLCSKGLPCRWYILVRERFDGFAIIPCRGFHNAVCLRLDVW